MFRRKFREREIGEALVRQHDVHGRDREVEQFPVLDLGAHSGGVGQHHVPPGAEDHRVAGPQDRAGSRLGDDAVLPDTLDEHARRGE